MPRVPRCDGVRSSTARSQHLRCSKPETLYQRRQLSRTLSDTAFAWPMVLPTYARSQRLGSAGEALECMLVSEWNMNLLVLLAT